MWQRENEALMTEKDDFFDARFAKLEGKAGDTRKNRKHVRRSIYISWDTLFLAFVPAPLGIQPKAMAAILLW